MKPDVWMRLMAIFRFWSELSETERYQVEYRGKRWTGYSKYTDPYNNT